MITTWLEVADAMKEINAEIRKVMDAPVLLHMPLREDGRRVSSHEQRQVSTALQVREAHGAGLRS